MNDNFDVNDVITEYENMYKEQTRTAVILQAQLKGLIKTIEQRDAIINDLETQLKEAQNKLAVRSETELYEVSDIEYTEVEENEEI